MTLNVTGGAGLSGMPMNLSGIGSAQSEMGKALTTVRNGRATPARNASGQGQTMQSTGGTSMHSRLVLGESVTSIATGKLHQAGSPGADKNVVAEQGVATAKTGKKFTLVARERAYQTVASSLKEADRAALDKLLRHPGGAGAQMRRVVMVMSTLREQEKDAEAGTGRYDTCKKALTKFLNDATNDALRKKEMLSVSVPRKYEKLCDAIMGGMDQTAARTLVDSHMDRTVIPHLKEVIKEAADGALPSGKDPLDLVRENPKAALEQKIDTATEHVATASKSWNQLHAMADAIEYATKLPEFLEDLSRNDPDKNEPQAVPEPAVNDVPKLADEAARIPDTPSINNVFNPINNVTVNNSGLDEVAGLLRDFLNHQKGGAPGADAGIQAPEQQPLNDGEGLSSAAPSVDSGMERDSHATPESSAPAVDATPAPTAGSSSRAHWPVVEPPARLVTTSGARRINFIDSIAHTTFRSLDADGYSRVRPRSGSFQDSRVGDIGTPPAPALSGTASADAGRVRSGGREAAALAADNNMVPEPGVGAAGNVSEGGGSMPAAAEDVAPDRGIAPQSASRSTAAPVRRLVTTDGASRIGFSDQQARAPRSSGLVRDPDGQFRFHLPKRGVAAQAGEATGQWAGDVSRDPQSSVAAASNPGVKGTAGTLHRESTIADATRLARETARDPAARRRIRLGDGASTWNGRPAGADQDSAQSPDATALGAARVHSRTGSSGLRPFAAQSPAMNGQAAVDGASISDAAKTTPRVRHAVVAPAARVITTEGYSRIGSSDFVGGGKR